MSERKSNADQEKFSTISPQDSFNNSLSLFVFIAIVNSVEAEQKQTGKTTPNNLTHLDQFYSQE